MIVVLEFWMPEETGYMKFIKEIFFSELLKNNKIKLKLFNLYVLYIMWIKNKESKLGNYLHKSKYLNS